jgi:hypothetical protein
MPHPEYVAGLPPEPSKVLALFYIPMDHPRDLDALLDLEGFGFQFPVYHHSVQGVIHEDAAAVVGLGVLDVQANHPIHLVDLGRFSIFNGPSTGDCYWWPTYQSGYRGLHCAYR